MGQWWLQFFSQWSPRNKIVVNAITFECTTRDPSLANIAWLLTSSIFLINSKKNRSNFSSPSRSLVILFMVVSRFVKHELSTLNLSWALWRSLFPRSYVAIESWIMCSGTLHKMEVKCTDQHLLASFFLAWFEDKGYLNPPPVFRNIACVQNICLRGVQVASIYRSIEG